MKMIRNRVIAVAFLLLTGGLSLAVGQAPPDPAKLMSAQRDAMAPLAALDGMWRGTAWAISPSGDKHTLTQTERVGPFLNGSVKVIEGKGYEADGSVGFNAFATVSYDPTKRSYSMHSYAQGQAGDFAFRPTPDGFIWEIPAGSMTIRYTAVIKDGTWHEVGDRVVPGKDPVRFFEMTLKRIGDTNWPAGGAVSPK